MGLVHRISALVLLSCLTIPAARAQGPAPMTNDEIRRLIGEFKQDDRGPFQAIRWFCPDGSVIPARERCAQPGGIQHALHKDIVVRLQSRNRIYLGQILAGTPNEAFLDEERFFSRLKQYQLEKFLIDNDDGWILRRARYYRGAYQAEDEEAWGKQFLEWALGRPNLARSWYFTVREAARDLPHEAADNLVQRIRAVSRDISDAYPAFLDLRVKIHGQPTAADTSSVRKFRQQHSGRMPAQLAGQMDQLLKDLSQQYGADRWTRLRVAAERMPTGSSLRARIASYTPAGKPVADRVAFLTEIIQASRTAVEESSRGAHRLRLLDVSLAAEYLLFTEAAEWRARTIGESLMKVDLLSRAAHGSGLIENWEWREVEPLLNETRAKTSFTASEFESALRVAQRVAEWGIGTVTATFSEVVDLYRPFEPLAEGFLDDRMRSTVLLALGAELGTLHDEAASRSGRTNEVMGLKSASGIRGLNPGIAVGELVVEPGGSEHIDFKTDKIYVVGRAPADLKPVAGIATVSEGNIVSHVQLLARNLGIPNAVLSPALLRDLQPLAGQVVFYAVSPGGVVRIKPASAMTPAERALVEERKRSEERIAVPTGRLDLNNLALENLYNLKARDSGVLCGPKAANLGQLSSLFPGRVAPGFIIPFGVFRQHMEQGMPGTGGTYWAFLEETFRSASTRRSRGEPEDAVETEVLERLSTLRSAIEKMPLRAELVAELRARFVAIFGSPVGSVPVFVRSDTNMEDLKDFTGAGLNLTVPNVVTEADLLQAIRRVWASPYRERGYRWRQKYLVNPQDVYPSLLILRSVNVEKSGVMITSGISSGSRADATVAFNRGVGGAVDGQAAESYLITPRGAVLESPAREPRYSTLPSAGGVERRITSFDMRILSPEDLRKLADLAGEVRRRLPGTPGIETTGPFDVELGFLGPDIRLFQTRPFVENRAAASTLYLSAMDSRSKTDRTIGASDRIRFRN